MSVGSVFGKPGPHIYSPFVLLVLPPPCLKWAEFGRGRPCSLAELLACSLGFHTITFECNTSTPIGIFKTKLALNRLVSLFGHLVARSGRKRGNRQTDRRTKYRPSTVTLAEHVPRVNY